MVRLYQAYTIDCEGVKMWDNFFRKQVFNRLYSIVLGVFGSYLVYYTNRRWKQSKIIKFTVSIVFLIFCQVDEALRFIPYNSSFYTVWYFSLKSIAWLLLFPFVEELKISNHLMKKIITRTSILSYGMYLLNLSVVLMKIIPFIKNLTVGRLGGVTYFIIYYLLTMFLAWVLYQLYERRTTKLRDRFSG